MDAEIKYGYCQCGCGNKTKINRQTVTGRGWIKGEPRLYIKGHNSKNNFGYENNHWKGGRLKPHDDYIRIMMPEHPRSNSDGYVIEHILIAEQVLGKHINQPIEIHHFNGIKNDNSKNNIIICENRKYHQLLHIRHKAFIECGNANYRKCSFCKKYDDPNNLKITETRIFHQKCLYEYKRITR